MKLTKIILMGTSLFLIVSCAGIEKDWQTSMCNKEGAYQQGMNDAREGKKMQSYGDSCPLETRNDVFVGYREGYTAGITSTNSQSGKDRSITINIGNKGQSANSRAWYCKTSAFTDSFEVFGATQLEAQESVKDQCRQKYDKMFCEKVNCRKNI